MCITSETCRAKSVIKLTLNNLHQAGPSKPIFDDAWKHKNQIRECQAGKDILQLQEQEENVQNKCSYLVQ